MSRRFRICMAKGGKEALRPSYGRSKLTLISREKKYLRRCYEESLGHNFNARGEDVRNIYEKFSQGHFALALKLVFNSS